MAFKRTNYQFIVPQGQTCQFFPAKKKVDSKSDRLMYGTLVIIMQEFCGLFLMTVSVHPFFHVFYLPGVVNDGFSTFVRLLSLTV